MLRRTFINRKKMNVIMSKKLHHYDRNYNRNTRKLAMPVFPNQGSARELIACKMNSPQVK